MTTPLQTRCAVRLALAVLALTPAILSGQTRADLLNQAQEQYNNFQETRTVELLRKALDPSLGAPDLAWAGGVQQLAQILLRNGQADEATAWLRWAHRLFPGMTVDSIKFTPVVVSAFNAAAAFVASAGADPLTRTSWLWSTRAGGFGDLRVEAAEGLVPALQVMVDGVGFVDPGQPKTLAPGSYRVVGQAPGRGSATVTTEVLPGVSTVVTIGLRPADNVVATKPVARMPDFATARLVRIDANRLGEPGCGVGFFAGRDGLLLTSYRSIRGAGTLGLRLPDGRRVSRVRVAAYDVNADLAVLTTGETGPLDTLAVATDAKEGRSGWATHYPTCGDAPTASPVRLAGVGPDSLGVADVIQAPDQGGALVDTTGAVLGFASSPRTVRSLNGAATLLEAARRNVAGGSTSTVADVARREKHVYGEVTLRSSTAGARARVSPLDVWQWAGAGRTDSLPFTFRGPSGRYLIEVLIGTNVQQRTEVNVDGGQKTQIALGPRRQRGFPTLIVGGAAAAVGGLVALLAGGGAPPPPPTVGSITITLPR